MSPFSKARQGYFPIPLKYSPKLGDVMGRPNKVQPSFILDIAIFIVNSNIAELKASSKLWPFPNCYKIGKFPRKEKKELE